jgi:arylsulfatase A-like enzyme
MILRLVVLAAISTVVVCQVTALSAAEGGTIARPNIVYILCDDLGYGDVHAFNPERGKIATPNIDRLASEGMMFTDAHSGSSVCTPTRYGILTGRYAWRTRLQKGVLNGMSEPLISRERLTVPALLKQQGYATAMIGKWHLGLTFGENKWRDALMDGPRQHGFDYFFGISASLDMPPFAYIENDHFTQEPTVEKKWVRAGPAARDFEAENVLPDLTHKACEYVTSQAADANSGKPFFLYLALTSPHTPIVPTKEWQGKSGLGEYGDFVMETDWAAGEVLKAIEAAGLAANTLVIFTSDNGCSPAAGIPKLEAQGHYPSADFRGYKADIWDGGHRIPFIARWPGKIKAGSRSDATCCLTDLMATCAEIAGGTVPASAGQDSVSIASLMLGRDDGPRHEAVVHHSIDGAFAIRKGKWKLEFCPGSGGWGSPRDAEAVKQNLAALQLYDMTSDESEKRNLAAEKPEVVSELTMLLEKYVADGRSTPGAQEANDVKVTIRKAPARAEAE